MAMHAYNGVQEFRKKYSGDAEKLKEANDKFKSYAKSILSYVQLNGLVAAFAFVETKKGAKDSTSSDAYNGLYNITKDWLINECGAQPQDVSYISNYFARLESEQYRAVQQEIIKLYGWIRRYAES